MKNLIQEYQRVYQRVASGLEEHEEVLAAFVFGSMVTGDLWENSDIDFFVVMKSYEEGMHNLYSNEEGIAVHLKILSKPMFMKLKALDIRGGYVHRLFASSKMVFCKDDAVRERYNQARFYPEMDRRKWTLSYLGRLVKLIDSTEKFINNNNLFGAYKSLLESMELYAAVFVNSRGYMVSKDTLRVAANMDQEFQERFDYLVKGTNLEEKVLEVNRYLKNRLDGEIHEASEILIGYLRAAEEAKSAAEIARDPFFQGFDIYMEAVLSLLHEKNLIKRSFRMVSVQGVNLMKENVYRI